MIREMLIILQMASHSTVYTVAIHLNTGMIYLGFLLKSTIHVDDYHCYPSSLKVLHIIFILKVLYLDLCKS